MNDEALLKIDADAQYLGYTIQASSCGGGRERRGRTWWLVGSAGAQCEAEYAGIEQQSKHKRKEGRKKEKKKEKKERREKR